MLIRLEQGFLNWGARPPWGAQKTCQWGMNDLVIVLVMRTSKEIKIHREIFYAVFSDRITNKLSPLVFNLIFLSRCGRPVIASIFLQMDHECNKIS